MKNTWQIIHECDAEDGSPACWAKRADYPEYGKFVWISLYGDKEYAVEVQNDSVRPASGRLYTIILWKMF